jgi:hypothetical protein
LKDALAKVDIVCDVPRMIAVVSQDEFEHAGKLNRGLGMTQCVPGDCLRSEARAERRYVENEVRAYRIPLVVKYPRKSNNM